MSFDNLQQPAARQSISNDESSLESPQWEANRIGSLLKNGDPQFAVELSQYANALRGAGSISDAEKQSEWNQFLTNLSSKAPADVHVTKSGAQGQADIDASSEIYVAHSMKQLQNSDNSHNNLDIVNQYVRQNVQPQDRPTFVADFNRRTAEEAQLYTAHLKSDSTSGGKNSEIVIEPIDSAATSLKDPERIAQFITHSHMNGDDQASVYLAGYMNYLNGEYGNDQAQLNAHMGDFAQRLHRHDPDDFRVINDGHGHGSFDFDMTSEIHVKHSLGMFNDVVKNEFLQSHDAKGAVDAGLKNCNEYLRSNINQQDTKTFVSDFNRRSAEMGVRLEAFHGGDGLPQVRRTNFRGVTQDFR